MISFPLLAVAFAAIVVILPDSPWSRRARAGMAALWLGLASFVVIGGGSTPDTLFDRIRSAAPPAAFMDGSTAMVALGCLLGVIAGGLGARDNSRASGARAIAAAAAIVMLSGAVWLGPLWGMSAPGPTVLVMTAIGGASLVAARAGGMLHLRQLIVRADRRLTPTRWAPGELRARPRWELPALLGASVIAAIPTVTTVVAGIVLAAVIFHLRARRRGGVPRFPLGVFAALGLLPPLWLLLTVTGSASPLLSRLAEAPLSPAAELWIAPWIVLGSWILLGLWPVQSWVPRPLIAALVGVAAVGIGIGGVPLGLTAFQPWLAPLLVLSTWWGAATRRWDLMLGSLAMFGVLAAPASGRWWLLLPFVAVSLVGLVGEIARPAARSAALKAALILAGPGLWIGLVAGLQTQVVYTVLCVLAVAAAVASADAENGLAP